MYNIDKHKNSLESIAIICKAILVNLLVSFTHYCKFFVEDHLLHQ